MQLLIIILIVVAILITMEVFKHHLQKSLMKYAITACLVILILLILSAYVDVAQFFAKDNPIATTGAAVTENIDNGLKNFHPERSSTFQDIQQWFRETIHKVVDN